MYPVGQLALLQLRPQKPAPASPNLMQSASSSAQSSSVSQGSQSPESVGHVMQAPFEQQLHVSVTSQPLPSDLQVSTLSLALHWVAFGVQTCGVLWQPEPEQVWPEGQLVHQASELEDWQYSSASQVSRVSQSPTDRSPLHPAALPVHFWIVTRSWGWPQALRHLYSVSTFASHV